MHPRSPMKMAMAMAMATATNQRSTQPRFWWAGKLCLLNSTDTPNSHLPNYCSSPNATSESGRSFPNYLSVVTKRFARIRVNAVGKAQTTVSVANLVVPSLRGIKSCSRGITPSQVLTTNFTSLFPAITRRVFIHAIICPRLRCCRKRSVPFKQRDIVHAPETIVQNKDFLHLFRQFDLSALRIHHQLAEDPHRIRILVKLHFELC